jgi:DNA recombination protein RmuC
MEAIIFIIVGFIAGSGLSWFVIKSIQEKKVNALISEKDAGLNEAKATILLLQAKLDSQSESMEVIKKTMIDTFKSAASDALGQNNKQFLDLAKTHFDAQLKNSEGNLDKRKVAIEEMLKPVRESIDSYKKRIEELEGGSKQTFGQVQEMLKNLQTTHASLQKETGALVNALRNPRVRGKWGEIGLRRAVEYSGMSSHCDFIEQAYTGGDDSVLKPDMIINLPGNSHVVVDSKLPLDAYLEALETDDDTSRNLLLTKHARTLRDHITKLSRKQYWSQFPNTPDFVVLYMEVESALNVALMTDRTLLQYAMDNKIILATPTTLIVVLKSVAMSWQQHNITENALEINKAANELYDRINVFACHLEKIQGGLNSALKAYNDAVGSWEGRIIPAGKKLEQLRATDDKKGIPGLIYIDTPVRQLKTMDEKLKTTDDQLS